MLVVVNKVDDERREADVWDVRQPRPRRAVPGVGACTGGGAATSSTRIVAALPPERRDADAERRTPSFSVAIVGRPNVGKSTLFNRLVGDDRSVVHDLPGTTRDSDRHHRRDRRRPAPLRRHRGHAPPSRIDEPTEYFSLVRALEAVDRADAALLVIDATDGVTHQDQRLAERIDAAGTAVVIVLNKWDLVADPDERRQIETDVADRLAFLGYAPVLKVSALTGKNVMPRAPRAAPGRGGVPPADPDRGAEPGAPGRPGRAPAAARRAGTGRGSSTRPRAPTDPPTFTLFATHELPPTYLRYLERRIREAFDLGPTPIKLRVRRRNS